MAIRRPSVNPAVSAANHEESVQVAVDLLSRPAPARVRVQPAAPALVEEDLYEEEDPDEEPTRASVVQAGWGAANKLATSSEYAQDVRLSENDTLLRFIGSDPYAVFKQHFVRELGKGLRKSFVCLEHGCPLCDELMHKPDRKFAFNVLALTEDGGLAHQSLQVGPRLLGILKSLNEGKYGPLDKHNWAVHRIGSGTSTNYGTTLVRDGNLLEEWSVDPADMAKAVSEVVPYTAEIVRPSSRAELREVVLAVSNETSQR